MDEGLELGAGSVVVHPAFGRGTIARIDAGAYVVHFADGQTRRIEAAYTGWEIERRFAPSVEDTRPAEGTTAAELRKLLEDFGLVTPDAELGRRWSGGKMVLMPGKTETQPKEVPLDIFFKKLIGVRERLRVLEQKLNNHPSLSPEDKLELQGYITRCYGSLTTFNVLFADKSDYFVGSGKDE